MAEREYERDDAGKFSGVGGGVARKQHEALAKLGKAKKDAPPAEAPKHEIYSKLGFKADSQSTFNPTFAPPNWNTQKHDSPDYFTMRL